MAMGELGKCGAIDTPFQWVLGLQGRREHASRERPIFSWGVHKRLRWEVQTFVDQFITAVCLMLVRT